MKNLSLHLVDNQGFQSVELRAPFLSVGTSAAHNIVVLSKTEGLVCSLRQDAQGVEIIPHDRQLKLNGKTLKSGGLLKVLDRVDWDDGSFVLTQSSSFRTEVTKADSTEHLKILERVAAILQASGSFHIALHALLDYLVQQAGAENATLMWQNAERDSWDLMASRLNGINDPVQIKNVMSQTVLNEAVKSRKPVVVESLIGHPWAAALSIVQTNLYSVACVPLLLDDEVCGAVFFSTQNPSRLIRREALEPLQSLCSVAMLLTMARMQSQRSFRDSQQRASTQIQGSSLAVKKLKERIEKLAPTPLSILIQGETGSGKELVARSLHQQSGRKSWVALNCAAIPETLLESTLFGVERGAFTGATRSSIGKIQQAHGGTLFLDEIGDLPLVLQAKLLRVLQEKVVEPVGSLRSVPVDIRVISASHQSLEKLVEQGKFRQDLLFRLKGAEIKVPSLKERSDDIGTLSEIFIKACNVQKSLSAAALEKLKNYSWPGNIRELEHCIHRAAYLTSGFEIQANDLELQSPLLESSARDFEEAYLGKGLKDAQKLFTRDYARKVFKALGSDRSKTASDLRISERTLYRILEDDPNIAKDV